MLIVCLNLFLLYGILFEAERPFYLVVVDLLVSFLCFPAFRLMILFFSSMVFASFFIAWCFGVYLRGFSGFRRPWFAFVRLLWWVLYAANGFVLLALLGWHA